jgi:hypothetical protein
LARRFGATDIVDLQTGHLSKVFGQVQSVTVDPSGSVARFQATIADGSGQLHCIWLGRRRIRGIIPDALITVVGRPAKLGAGLAIYDPAYQLLPAGAEDQAIDATS